MAKTEKRISISFNPQQVEIMDDLIKAGVFQTYASIIKYYMSKELDRINKTRKL